jgi:hypothetical protein
LADFDSLARPVVENLLEPGESLLGIVAATHQKTFSGQLYAIGVTDRRLILQPLGRRIDANGPARLVTPEVIESVKLDGAGEGWPMEPSRPPPPFII